MQEWDPQLYRQFEAERTRPAKELLARVSQPDVRYVTDLGCGPGNSTELLVDAWPQAKITGLDSSEAMLKQARERLPQCTFIHADIRTWQPDVPQQVIYANASLHWVEEHATLFPHLVSQLDSAGTLAVQMPDNLDEPSHRLMREVAENSRRDRGLSTQRDERNPLLTAEKYYDFLTQAGCEVDIWRATYYHVMPDVQAIVTWLQSTGLRPFLAPLNRAEQTDYLQAYHEQLLTAYPPQADGRVLLAFPRLFIVAMKKG